MFETNVIETLRARVLNFTQEEPERNDQSETDLVIMKNKLCEKDFQ